MCSLLVTEAFYVATHGRTEWPDNVQLIQPLADQLVLPQLAKCYSIEVYHADHLKARKVLGDDATLSEALLVFKRLPFEIVFRQNAEFMSPSGNVPFLRVDEEAIGEESIFPYLQRKGLLGSKTLTPEENTRVRALMSLVERVLVPAERHCAWIIPENAEKSCKAYGSGFVFPLNKLLCRKVIKDVRDYLCAVEWETENVATAKDKITEFFEAVSLRLSTFKFLSSDSPTEADAIVCGHLRAILEADLPNNFMKDALENFPKVTDYLSLVENELNR